jgi:DNA-binding IclR family transcriptional regulator
MRCMAGGAAQRGRSVTSRALAVLDAFDASAPRLSLSEIAERSGTPLTTAHRLLAELTGWGALSRRPDGRYEIGRKLWDLGLLAPVQLELRQVAAPFLLDVHTATRDTVHLAVRDGLSALYVERISGRESVPVVSQVGSRLPLHATGVGKVLLAAAPDEVVAEALTAPARPTRHTVVDPGRLRRELAEVRRRGWARTAEEMSLGTLSVAVPVRVERAGGTVVAAALGIVVPSHRRDLPRLVPVLEVAARGIGRALTRGAHFR